jgi:hypothetical protein
MRWKILVGAWQQPWNLVGISQKALYLNGAALAIS